MVEIIPAIDLIGGECVRLLMGDYSQKVVYSKDPVEVAREWEERGAKRLHVVDLDGAKVGSPQNMSVIRDIIKSTKLEVELGGGLRDEQTIEEVLDAGVHYAILGTAALENRTLLEWASQRFGKRIILGVDARNGKVAVRGWLEQSNRDATDLIIDLNNLELGGVIYTDIARDGAMVGPNLESLHAVADISECPVTASGGVTIVDDVRNIARLNHPKIVAVIIGKALYEKKIVLEEAIEAGMNPE